jgi:hypothetical protein
MTTFIQNLSSKSKRICNEFYHDNTNATVIENFLTNNDFKTAKEIIYKLLNCRNIIDPSIKYGHTSVGWHPYFVPHWSIDLTDIDFFSKHVFSEIKNLHEWTSGFEIKRIYASFQTEGMNGQWHFDDPFTTAFTFCLYFNFTSLDKSYEKDETMLGYKNNFKIINSKYSNMFTYTEDDKKEYDYNNNDIVQYLKNINHLDNSGHFMMKFSEGPPKFVRTIDNNAALFNSTVMHVGDQPRYNHSNTNLRCVVAYKLYLPDYQNMGIHNNS